MSFVAFPPSHFLSHYPESAYLMGLTTLLNYLFRYKFAHILVHTIHLNPTKGEVPVSPEPVMSCCLGEDIVDTI